MTEEEQLGSSRAARLRSWGNLLCTAGARAGWTRRRRPVASLTVLKAPWYSGLGQGPGVCAVEIDGTGPTPSARDRDLNESPDTHHASTKAPSR
jgi:hypothetical protein